MRVYVVGELPPAAKMNGQSAMVSDGSGPVDCSVGGGLFFVICTSNGSVYSARTIGSPGSGNVNTTGNLVNGNVPIATGSTTLADGGQAYPAGPFADTNSAQVFSHKDLSSSTNTLPNTIPLLTGNNLFTGTNTFRTLAGTSDIIVSTGAAAQQSFVRFDDQGTEKWAIGKNSDNTFFLFDAAHNQFTMSTNGSGNLLLGSSAVLSPSASSGASNSNELVLDSRKSDGTLLANTFTSDSNGSMNWQPGLPNGSFNLLPLSINNVPSPAFQFTSYSPAGDPLSTRMYEDPGGNVQSLAGAFNGGFNWYTSTGAFLATLQSNGDFSSARCLLIGTLGASWCQGFGVPSSTPNPGSIYSRTDTGNIYTYTNSQWLLSGGDSGCLNILDYGGNPNNVGSNNAAWTAVLAAQHNPNAVCVYFPAGSYLFATSPVWTAPGVFSSITVKGDGSGVSQTYAASGQDGLILTLLDTNNAFHIRGLSFRTNGINSGIGVAVNNHAAGGLVQGTAQSDFTDVSFNGGDCSACTDYWAYAIDIDESPIINFDQVKITGQPIGGGTSGLGVGVNLGTTSGVPGVVYNFSKCEFDYVGNGIQIQDHIQGVTIDQSNFTALNIGIYVPPGIAYGDNDQLVITNSQFAAVANGIDIESPFRHTQISDDYFIVGAGVNGILLNNYAMTQISNSQFLNGGAGGGNAIVFGTYAHDVSTVSNVGMQFFATGINLQSASQKVMVASYHGDANGADVVNAGTNNIVAVSCPAGAPSASYTVVNGVITHC